MMDQEDVVKILAGGAKVVKKASNNVKTFSAEYIKEHILDNQFVTRDEYKQLQKLVFKLADEVESLKKK